MNKKFIVYSVLMMHLIAFLPSFAMNALVVRGLQGVAASYCIGKGVKKAYEWDKLMDEPVNGPPVPSKTEAWCRGVLSELDISNASLVPINLYNINKNQDMTSQFARQQWASQADKGFKVPIYSALDLKKSLGKKSVKAVTTIAKNKMAFMHEAGHYTNKDCKKRRNALVWIPIVTQAVSSGMNYIFNSVFSRQMPKTLPGAMLRGSVAVGMIMPKLLINEAGLQVHTRSQENGADDFARNNAKTRLELKLYEDMWRSSSNNFEEILKDNPVILSPYKPENVSNIVSHGYVICAEKGLHKISHQLKDPQISERKEKILVNLAHTIVEPSHPYAGKRADNTKNFLAKWDAEHPADKSFVKAIEQQ